MQTHGGGTDASCGGVELELGAVVGGVVWAGWSNQMKKVVY